MKIPLCAYFCCFPLFFYHLKKNTVAKMPLFMLYISEKQGFKVPQSLYVWDLPTPLEGFEMEQVQ